MKFYKVNLVSNQNYWNVTEKMSTFSTNLVKFLVETYESKKDKV